MKNLDFDYLGLKISSLLCRIYFLRTIPLEWKDAFFAAVKESDVVQCRYLIANRPNKMSKSLACLINTELSKIFLVDELIMNVDNLAQYTNLDEFEKAELRDIFLSLKHKGITQIVQDSWRDEDYPSILDVWCGFDWRPASSDSERFFFLLSECFTIH